MTGKIIGHKLVTSNKFKADDYVKEQKKLIIDSNFGKVIIEPKEGYSINFTEVVRIVESVEDELFTKIDNY